jgi:hypothetical protein
VSPLAVVLGRYWCTPNDRSCINKAGSVKAKTGLPTPGSLAFSKSSLTISGNVST